MKNGAAPTWWQAGWVDHVKESRKWDCPNRFVTDFVRVDPKLAQPFSTNKIAPMADIEMKRKGVRNCSRNKPSGEKLAHYLYFNMLSLEFLDSIIIQWFRVLLQPVPIAQIPLFSGPKTGFSLVHIFPLNELYFILVNSLTMDVHFYKGLAKV